MTDFSNICLSDDKKLQPLVGISACLLGSAVRYDGSHKLQPLIQLHLAPWLNLISFCPEVSAGLGTPRPPVNLVRQSDGIKALGVEQQNLDVTDALDQAAAEYAAETADKLVAYIVKSRSPSCGAGTAPLYANQQIIDSTDGLFVKALRLSRPDLLFVDEEDLNSIDSCQQFREQCYTLALRGPQRANNA